MIGFKPKVAGSSMLMPASGPTPGSMPTRVPTTHPTNAYTRTEGWSATEKPSIRLWNVSAICRPAHPSAFILSSYSPRPYRQRHPQPRCENEIGEQGKPQRNRGDHPQRLALDDADEEHEQREDRQPVAERLQRESGEPAAGEDHDRAGELRPAQRGEETALAARRGNDEARDADEDREAQRKIARPRLAQGSERIVAVRPGDEERQQQEKQPGDLVAAQAAAGLFHLIFCPLLSQPPSPARRAALRRPASIWRTRARPGIARAN